MTISLDPRIIFAFIFCALLWLFLKRFVEPRSLARMAQTPSDDLPGRSTSHALLGALRHLAGCAALAGALVLGGLLALRVYLANLSENDAGLGTLVSIRGWIDGTLNTALASSVAFWGAALALLAVLWVILSALQTRKRWTDALEARRNQIAEEVKGLSPQRLRETAEVLASDALSALDHTLAEKAQANGKHIDGALTEPLLQIGDGAAASLQDIEHYIATLRQPATADAATAEGKSQAELDEISETSAKALSARVAELKRDLRLELQTATGTQDVSLARAETNRKDYADRVPGQDAALRNLVIDAKMRVSQTLAESSARSEPELFHEWVRAFVSGKVAAQLAGKTGALARTAVLVTLLLGLVGIGAQVNGAMMRDTVTNLELSLGKTLADRELAAAIANRPEDVEEESTSDVALASDEETRAQLASAMRASVVRGMQVGNLGSAVRTVSRRQTFELSTINARQRILQASARPAPTRAASARASIHFEAQLPPTSGAVQQFDTMLDEAVDRRIDRMRRNEAVWRKMRASAARPASRDLVSREFLRAAFPGGRMPAPLAMRMWTERATMDVARAAVRAGNIPDGYTPRTRVEAMPELFSNRDRRVIRDFDARTPRQVTSHLASVDTGRVDPGSLHRASASPRTPRPGGGASAYARTFPTAPGGGGAGVSSSRSYSKIRFNRRVGGVVIGRDPEAGDVSIEIIAFEWRQISDALIEITVTSQATGPVILGQFHPAIAHHALAYAADGRVVTATLPQLQAQPATGAHHIDVPTRQIVVHPAFEDTAFACAAIEIDRFVDKNMYADGPEAALLQAERRAVTDFGRLLDVGRRNVETLRRQTLTNAEEAQIVADILDYLGTLKPYVSSCGIGKECFPVDLYARAGLEFDGADSLLSCLQSSDDLVASCTAAVKAMDNLAAYSVDSGVREQPYALDPQLSFLRMDAHATDTLWPLDFIVQAVPTSLTRDDINVPDDLDPWVFPKWGNDLRSLVARDVKANADVAQVLEHMRQFTVLQRLFRLALAGELGLDFPLDALVDLQLATRDHIKVERHPHWNINHARPSQDFVTLLQGEEQGVVAAMMALNNGSAPAACSSSVQQHLAIAAEQEWPRDPSIWPTLGTVAEACDSAQGSSEFLKRYDALQDLQLIEEALAIHEAVTKPAPPGICPPL